MQQLAALHTQGLLTDDEFAAAKAQALGSDPATVEVRVDEAEPYARLAAVYDEIVVDPCHRVWASYLHELWVSDPAQVHSVLDLGCGTGLMAAAL